MARLFDDAASDYLELGSTPVTAVPLTLAAWFNKDDTAITGTVLAIGNNTAGGTNDRFRIRYGGAEDVFAETRSTLAAGEAQTTGGGSNNIWTHGAAVFAATNSRTAYRDGANSASNVTDVTPLSLNVVNIGCNYATIGGRQLFWSGSIAEAAIWNRALSVAEVFSLAQGYSPLFFPHGRVFYLPLNSEILGVDLDNLDGGDPVATGTTRSNHPKIIYPNQLFFKKAASLGAATISAITAELIFEGKAADISTQIAVPTASFSFGTPSPSIKGGASVRPNPGAFIFEGQSPRIAGGSTITPSPGAFLLDGQAPSIKGGASVRPDPGSIVFDGQIPIVTQGISAIQPPSGEIVFSGQEPSVIASVPKSYRYSVNKAPSVSMYDSTREKGKTVGSDEVSDISDIDI